MNKILSVIAVAALLLALSGCASEYDAREGTNDQSISVQNVKMQDGRTVTCIIYKAGYAGGISCDW